MLYDKNFLQELDKHTNKTIYARITALSIDEFPIDQIEGRVSQGSINIDGSSAVRRSCSLTIVAQNFNYSDYIWGLNTKFKLEIGIQNEINTLYPNIIWFNQGIYAITSFSSSRSTSNFNITIQGKDKMCLLNGELGGTIGTQTDFGTIEEEDSEGVWTIRPIPIPDIIKNMVHSYGGEPYYNIIIKDLDTQGLELLEYRYENLPLILYRKENSNTYSNMLFLTSDIEVSYYDNEDKINTLLKDVPDIMFEQLVDTLTEQSEPVVFYFNNDETQGYYLTKIQYGDVAGYRATDLTYAGDLIANVGESITSVLDKIKNMLVEYEYYYDIDGHFVFQKKQSFISTLWGPNENGIDEITTNTMLQENNSYTFNGSNLIISFNNNPNLMNVRNDFSIWGERTSVSGAKVPIHLRYAIDEKPTMYTTIGDFSEFDIQEIKDYNKKYGTTLKEESPISITYSIDKNYDQKQNYVQVGDWREVLYQMAKDYYQYNFLSNFELKVQSVNDFVYNNNKTGYEQYYTDIEVCWRQLYNPYLQVEINSLENNIENNTNKLNDCFAEIEIIKQEIIEINNQLNIVATQTEKDTYTKLLLSRQEAFNTKENEKKNLQNIVNSDKEKLKDKNILKENYYQINDIEEFTTIRNLLISLANINFISYTEYDERYKDIKYFKIPVEQISEIKKEEQVLQIKKGDLIYSENDNLYLIVKELDKKIYTEEVEYVYCTYYYNNKLYWNKNVFENPGSLNYWFDFLDSSGELSNFNVKAIGARTKAINETNIKSIYNREIPNVIFATDITEEEKINSYKYIQIPDLENMFTISARGKSAKDRLDELIYAHGYCSETATITSIPIYYLQPNTRIHIFDSDTKIDGDYIINKITIPLAYNGTMSLTTTKAAETLFF